LTKWLMTIACWIIKTTNTHTLLCNTHCFSTSTMFARTRLNITLYARCLPCVFCLQICLTCFLRNTSFEEHKHVCEFIGKRLLPQGTAGTTVTLQDLSCVRLLSFSVNTHLIVPHTVIYCGRDFYNCSFITF